MGLNCSLLEDEAPSRRDRTNQRSSTKKKSRGAKRKPALETAMESGSISIGGNVPKSPPRTANQETRHHEDRSVVSDDLPTAHSKLRTARNPFVPHGTRNKEVQSVTLEGEVGNVNHAAESASRKDAVDQVGKNPAGPASRSGALSGEVTITVALPVPSNGSDSSPPPLASSSQRAVTSTLFGSQHAPASGMTYDDFGQSGDGSTAQLLYGASSSSELHSSSNFSSKNCRFRQETIPVSGVYRRASAVLRPSLQSHHQQTSVDYLSIDRGCARLLGVSPCEITRSSLGECMDNDAEEKDVSPFVVSDMGKRAPTSASVSPSPQPPSSVKRRQRSRIRDAPVDSIKPRRYHGGACRELFISEQAEQSISAWIDRIDHGPLQDPQLTFRGE